MPEESRPEFESRRAKARNQAPRELPHFEEDDMEYESKRNFPEYLSSANIFETVLEEDILREGFKALDGFLHDILSREHMLPDVILFPDLGARPLAYAVKPFLSHFYAEAGFPDPALRFINVSRRPADIEQRIKKLTEELAQAERNKQSVLARQEQARFWTAAEKKRFGWTNPTLLDEDIAQAKKELEQASALPGRFDRGEFDERLEKQIGQLFSYLPKKNETTLIVDDALSVGETARSLRDAVKRHDPAQKVFYFAFIDCFLEPTTDEEKKDEHIQKRIAESRQFRAQEWVRAGVSHTSFYAGKSMDEFYASYDQRCVDRYPRVFRSSPNFVHGKSYDFKRRLVLLQPFFYGFSYGYVYPEYEGDKLRDKIIGVEKNMMDPEATIFSTPQKNVATSSLASLDVRRWLRKIGKDAAIQMGHRE